MKVLHIHIANSNMDYFRGWFLKHNSVGKITILCNIPFRVVVERVKNAEFRDSAVMKNGLYQFISTIYLLYLCFFKAKQVTLDYPNALNR